eukprot:Gregarina_sp_Poly_1__716@NODE_1170_length_4869_cov_152_708663_g801_i0_p3_GENE_NODE_1170_length_4869_cov_152_708663_g801_i0NODE_1170_length_4869_cov_152_708663_g801_i0_p3_ORF_typecomplete_len144_score20_75Ribosomal_L24e/PF01246_20/3_4e23_NODE_1170_length_4869_cov_152_708663_g801_i0135566
MSSRTAQATTTLKLDTCSFSDSRMYPGRGTIFVSRDGKQHIFCNHKVSSLFHQRIKPAKLTWTQAWRRANKKAVAHTGTGKRRTRHTVRMQKAIVGLSLDDLQKKKAAAEAARKNAPPAPTKKDAKKDSKTKEDAKKESKKPQ